MSAEVLMSDIWVSSIIEILLNFCVKNQPLHHAPETFAVTTSGLPFQNQTTDIQTSNALK